MVKDLSNLSITGISIASFSVLLILSKKRKYSSDIFLCFWLFFLTLPLFDEIYRNLISDSIIFRKISNPVITLVHGPFLYLYVTFLINKRKTSNLRYFIHFIPIIVLYLLFVFINPANPPRPGGGGNIILQLNVHLAYPLIKYFGLINLLVFLVYTINTICLLKRHRQDIFTYFSRDDNEITLQWIYLLPVIFIGLVGLIVLNEQYVKIFSYINPRFFHILAFVLFIIVLSFFGIKQKPLLYKENNKNTPEKNLISTQQVDKIIIKMESIMKKKKPYLDPSFSVDDLADILEIPRRILSHILNTRLSKNFFRYINEYRIEDAKLLLANNLDKKISILEIAYDAGFNSKSSFNSLFKQYCGVTPTEYRKKIQNN